MASFSRNFRALETAVRKAMAQAVGFLTPEHISAKAKIDLYLLDGRDPNAEKLDFHGIVHSDTPDRFTIALVIPPGISNQLDRLPAEFIVLEDFECGGLDATGETRNPHLIIARDLLIRWVLHETSHNVPRARN
jgi:hypothetical protein